MDFIDLAAQQRRIFSLPVHPYLAAGDQRRIAALFQ
jgi:dTDP-4-amino-4,6-dideoxygalactose transaminase